MGGMQLRTAALVGALALGVGWAVGTRMPVDRADGTAGRGSTGPRPLGVVPAATAQPFTEQLRHRLEHQPAAPRPSRNPFVFGSRPGVPGGSRPAPPSAPEPGREARPAAGAEEPPLPAPQFRLTGMAATDSVDGTEFTAILHDGRSLVFVKRGDTLAGGFEVVDVQESSVTLRDGTGAERILRLR